LSKVNIAKFSISKYAPELNHRFIY
jgi:hypothetical protein